MGSKKFTLEEVKEKFENRGFVMLDEFYINSRTLINCLCSCGSKHKISLSKLQAGQSCKKCASEKRKQTCLIKYGCEYAVQSPEIKVKIKDTFIKNLGVDNPMKNESIKKKQNNVLYEKYGEYSALSVPELRQKGIETSLRLYGFENPMQSPEIQEKSRNTSMKRYGTPNPMQNPIIFARWEKSALKRNVEYIFPSDNKILLQSNSEVIALDILLSMYTEDEIITNRAKIPVIEYEFHKKEHKYFPDFYIPSDNLIIEIKSIWTYNLHFFKNKCKSLFTRKAGFNFQLWIMDEQNKLILYEL